MNSKALLVVVSTLSLLAVRTASAVDLHDNPCVSASLEKTRQAVLDYASYPSLPGASLPNSVLARELDGLSRIPFLVITRGSADPRLIHMAGVRLAPDATPEDSRIWIELIAHDMKSGAQVADPLLRPRFMLHCTSSTDSGSGVFKQSCNMEPSPAPFGVSNFTSTLSVAADESCGPNQSRLTYSVHVDTDATQIARIRDAVTQSIGPLGSLAVIFQGLFIETYFKNFYKGWFDALRSGT